MGEQHRPRVIREIGERDDDVDEFWSAWQDALEAVILDRGVVEPGDIERRAVEFAEHS